MAGRSLDELGVTLSWRDLLVLTRRWQVAPGFALSEAVQGFAPWGITDQLLAELIDTASVGNWINTGNKNAPRPKPLKRPWEKTNAKTFGSGAIPLSEFDNWWDGGGK